MNGWRFLKLAFVSVSCGLVLGLVPGAMSGAGAQARDKPLYLDPGLPAEQRAADLVHRMTLDEKATQLVNQARAIPRLQVPAYDWWSEALHGVAVNGTTEFPEPIGLAATFDPATIHQMAVAISTEGRIKHAQAMRAGHSDIFQGLDFWAPNINIFRDPRWGRGQETYGEDPFLTAHMGVAFVTGMQGDDPHYYRVIATPKHYAVHSGPEPTRHTADVTVSKHDEEDTYLPAFRATVIEGKAASVMCAYNSINGQPACANQFLLDDQLRGKWGFTGYVVSDCEAVRNIFSGHHYTATQAEASAISLKRGMDNECIDFTSKVTDDHDYAPYLDAVKHHLLTEGDIDVALTRLFTARIRLGMFDPPAMVPYSKIDEHLLNGPAYRALARRLANESMVLLKNDGVLPLKPSGLKVAVVGPLAEQSKVLLGNYNGIPTHTVSVLEGLRTEFPGAAVTYVPGTGYLNKETTPVPAQLLSTDGKAGLEAAYSEAAPEMPEPAAAPTVLATRIEPAIGAGGALPPEVAGRQSLVVRWSGTLTPSAGDTGDYNLGFDGRGSVRVKLDGKVIVQASDADGTYAGARTGKVHLVAGTAYALEVTYRPGAASGAAPHLVWSKIDLRPAPEAVEAARQADVVVAVVGITSELEGEEMQVTEPGFKGGDRTSLDLPRPEQDLLEAVAATGKPLVVVLMNGSALSVNWAKAHANAILEAWYSGEEGGSAVAETLFGRNNPGGKLPVTFYTGLDQLPAFDDYSMKNRTYRYFSGTPLYPFGYGLSYTRFAYSRLKIPETSIEAGSPLSAAVTVRNTGSLAGDEVVELYLKFPGLPGAPLRALRGFQRVHLEPGASQEVAFHLQPRDLSMVSEAGEPTIAAGEYTVSIGGGQPAAQGGEVTHTFRIKDSLTLPE